MLLHVHCRGCWGILRSWVLIFVWLGRCQMSEFSKRMPCDDQLHSSRWCRLNPGPAFYSVCQIWKAIGFSKAFHPSSNIDFFYTSMFIRVKVARICLLPRNQPCQRWPKKILEATLNCRLDHRRDKRAECQSAAHQKRHTWTPSGTRDHMLAKSGYAALQMKTGQNLVFPCVLRQSSYRLKMTVT